MRILTLNCGSSSLKFRVVDVASNSQSHDSDSDGILIGGSLHGIGGLGTLDLMVGGEVISEGQQLIPDHAKAIGWVFDALERAHCGPESESCLGGIEAVGHRIVHGGSQFSESVRIDSRVLGEIQRLGELTPLHNTAQIAGIQGAQAYLGETIPMVAVFDTAFHHTLPIHARMYALPYDIADHHGIQRFGFHGIAHASLAWGYANVTGRSLEKDRLITMQLGNGSSMTAIAKGKSVETSMGFTPLEGLMMGTRSGDVDPSVVTFLIEHERMEASEVERCLNEQSGLLGVSGRSNDMRELLRAASVEQDPRATLAIELFCYRVRKFVGAYLAVLGGAEALVFGGGIGEGSPEVRDRICQGMGWCGLRLDPDRNKAAIGLQPGKGVRISQDGAKLAAFVVATDEEAWIARESVQCLQNA